MRQLCSIFTRHGFPQFFLLCSIFLVHFATQSQVQVHSHFRFNGRRLVTTCSWNKKSSKVSPSFFPGHLISLFSAYSSHIVFHGKCLAFRPFFEPAQVQRWLSCDLNISEMVLSLLVHSIHSISDPRSLWWDN